jgi:hypothetical protein
MTSSIRLPLGGIEYIESTVDEQERITLTIGYTDSQQRDHIIFQKRIDDIRLNTIQDVIEATQQMLMDIREAKRVHPLLDEQGRPVTLLGLPIYTDFTMPPGGIRFDAPPPEPILFVEPDGNNG